jgi:hypothetical protein
MVWQPQLHFQQTMVYFYVPNIIGYVHSREKNSVTTSIRGVLIDVYDAQLTVEFFFVFIAAMFE